MNFIKKSIEGIEGWLTFNEANLLYNLAKNLRGRGVIVEIGSWKGKSTICLGFGSRDGKKNKIYAIDPHTGAREQIEFFKNKKKETFEDFKNNIKKCKFIGQSSSYSKDV